MSRREAIRFGQFLLDLSTRELTREGAKVQIRTKPFEVLAYLAAQEGRIVPREELLAHVWPGVSVSHEAVTSALRDLRRAVGDGASPHRVVVTVRARGYRFEQNPAGHPASSDHDAMLQAAEALLARLLDQARECEALLRSLRRRRGSSASEDTLRTRRPLSGPKH